MSADTFPQYIRIAYFLASRIAEGDFPIGKRLSGRSKLSSEYQVSPETMRRALQILADMKVVEVFMYCLQTTQDAALKIWRNN